MSTYLQVWKALEKRPGSTAVELARSTHIARTKVSHALLRLRDKFGAVRMEEGGNFSRWYVVGDQPLLYPPGCNPKSTAALNKDYRVAMERLRRALKARGLNPVAVMGASAKQQPQPFVLGECWKLPPCKRAA